MKALNYLKDKVRFLIAFVICCAVLECKHDFVDTNSEHGYTKICIEGHEYYESINRVTIKLDDNGRPIRCVNTKK